MPQWITQCLSTLALVMVGTCAFQASAEKCTTQSQMQPTDRDALSVTAQTLAAKIQANDLMGLKAATIPELASDFSGIGNVITTTAPSLAGDTPEVEQVYLLDASDTKRNADGSAPDADFLCSLNKGSDEADFSINGLPPGRYGFTMVEFVGHSPWLVSLLLRQDGTGTQWKLAGVYPKETSAAGHDGLWYWSQARAMAAKKQSWVAYLEYREARDLLQPVGFVSSTHLENLRAESAAASPPELGDGISASSPLVIKSTGGKVYKFTSITPGNSLRKDKLDIVISLDRDPSITSPPAIRKDNLEAMTAWLSQHPDLRENFHGIWIFANAPGQAPVTTVAAMNEIP